MEPELNKRRRMKMVPHISAAVAAAGCGEVGLSCPAAHVAGEDGAATAADRYKGRPAREPLHLGGTLFVFTEKAAADIRRAKKKNAPIESLR